MKVIVLAVLIAVSAAAPSVYRKDVRADEDSREVVVVDESDVRNEDGSSRWSFKLSDETTREESNAQKEIDGELGNTNRGSSSHVAPDGQRITLTWVADENGFQPKGEHLPTPPPIPEAILEMLARLPKLEEVEEKKPVRKY